MSKLLFFVHSLLHFSVVDGLAEVMSVTFFWSHTGDFITSGLYCWRGNGACSEIFFPMICLSISPFSEHAANLGFFCWASLLQFVFSSSLNLHIFTSTFTIAVVPDSWPAFPHCLYNQMDLEKQSFVTARLTWNSPSLWYTRRSFTAVFQGMEVFGRCDFWMNKIAFAVVDFVLFLLSQEAEVLKRKKILILLFVTLQWIFISFCNVNFYAVELQSTLQASLMSALYLGRFLSGNVFFFILRCSSDLTGIYVCEKNSCTDGSCVINKLTGLFKEGCAFIPERNQTAVSSIMYMQSLSSVSTNMWEQISFNETYRYKIWYILLCYIWFNFYVSKSTVMYYYECGTKLTVRWCLNCVYTKITCYGFPS